jgi:hypothetical protein
MQRQARPPEARKERGERVDHRAELGKDQHLLLAGGDHLGDLAQALTFAAILFLPRMIGQPLRGGWLQICFSRINEASTSPLRAISSASSRAAPRSSTAFQRWNCAEAIRSW